MASSYVPADIIKLQDQLDAAKRVFSQYGAQLSAYARWQSHFVDADAASNPHAAELVRLSQSATSSISELDQSYHEVAGYNFEELWGLKMKLLTCQRFTWALFWLRVIFWASAYSDSLVIPIALLFEILAWKARNCLRGMELDIEPYLHCDNQRFLLLGEAVNIKKFLMERRKYHEIVIRMHEKRSNAHLKTRRAITGKIYTADNIPRDVAPVDLPRSDENRTPTPGQASRRRPIDRGGLFPLALASRQRSGFKDV